MTIYKTITTTLLELIDEADIIIDNLKTQNKLITNENKVNIKANIDSMTIQWGNKCLQTLTNNGLLIELKEFENYTKPPRVFERIDSGLENSLFYLKTQKSLLISQCKKLEDKSAHIEINLISIDDLDNFEAIKNVKANEVLDFSNSAFLEDDVEEAFLEILGESYKEMDSGSETRDLFTDKVLFKGKRLSTAIMFKGRGVSSKLTINKCGKNGDQLLKLSKNTACNCFIVQHVNKIEPDVREALIDHLLSKTIHQSIYVGFIDGNDTARFLKSIGKNLDDLKNKKHK